MGYSQISGTWTPLDSELHISCLELKAVGTTLHHWASVLQGHQVMIATSKRDPVPHLVTSSSGAFYVVTSSEHTCSSPSKTHSRLSERDSRPPISSQSADNDRVESPSRNRESNFQILGYSSSGLVCNCFKLPPFSVHICNSGATSTRGGCSVSGLAGRSMYMFPPFPLLSKVIQKLQDTQEAEVILIAPWWPKQSWFPTSSLCGLSAVLSIPPRSSVSTGSEICLGRKIVLSACI